MGSVLLFFFSGILTGWFFTRASILISLRYRIEDVPEGRSSHNIATPRLGGVGVAASFFLFCVLYLFPVSRIEGFPEPGIIPPLLLGGTGCFLMGLWDDLRRLKAPFKLILQTLCALVPIIFGLRIHSLALFAGLAFPPSVGYAAALCWILFMINAFNFMDGMNGLAGTFATVAFIFLSALTGMQGKSFALLFMFLAASCIGFLVYNLTPAMTFMGDSGSQFLGYVLAVIPLYLHHDNRELFPFGTFVILFFPFIYDVLFTLGRRVLRNENLFEAHRTHLYQRLMIAGWSHPGVLRILFILFLICGFSSLGFARTKSTILRALLAFIALLAMSLYALFVLRREEIKNRIQEKGSSG
ncbi:undecaprenyl/decaprenyl-phosphate alpha-N-acetylglucosaminyl 1-phosphate transferase [Candidatus Sumerlaeota bacterium]|nr:undecaprenyl/decaprenyl-phosphate alpha-N-acetylglucosaminyl 1-phosphate transferase [Candidatus Sumerlaeota bacterium]